MLINFSIKLQETIENSRDNIMYLTLHLRTLSSTYLFMITYLN